MKPTVSTVNVVDPRIEPQGNPVFTKTIAPKQNQFYKVPASGLSDSFITFNNLTTLGEDRAYLDSFELEITADITFTPDADHTTANYTIPGPAWWTFDSFPFNKCCEEVRVNINGGAFFSQPLSYLRAKERYWDDEKLNESYGNVCPCNKPQLQDEGGVYPAASGSNTFVNYLETIGDKFEASGTGSGVYGALALPTRLPIGSSYYMPTASGMAGSSNSSIIPRFAPVEGGTNHTIRVTWREPVMCPPFSSRIDANYGKPLYRISTMDLSFNMQDLGHMIRYLNNDANFASTDYNIHLVNVSLCYQVETIPPGMTPPPYTVVPYRRFVPYITNAPSTYVYDDDGLARNVTMSSGVYTLNEVPEAIWVFAAPTKKLLQQNTVSNTTQMTTAGDVPANYTTSDWTSNKLFGFLNHISISMGNTTQILNTAEPLDLYRIAKANGCQDSFSQWGRSDPMALKLGSAVAKTSALYRRCPGPGSVLRLIPGKDIVLPEQDLVPGANANNMVLQVHATFDLPRKSAAENEWALWLLFEYVGVATITTGQCEITMNPVGDGRIMTGAPLVPASIAEAAPPTAEGSGFLDKVKGAVNYLRNNKLISRVLGTLGGVGSAVGTFFPHPAVAGIASGLSTAAATADKLGYGVPYKRARGGAITGGAVMGLGDFC